MSEEEVQEYEEFIAYTPKRFQMIDGDIYQMAKEYGTIISALNEGNKSVKEIHDLYKIPGTKKHTKTLKTIYRYMDILEKADLVKVAGYRKYTKKRATEKLYCRTARVFFNRDNQQKEYWYTSEEGQEFVKSVTHVIWSINDKPDDPPPELNKLITEYMMEGQEQANKIIEKITSDEKLASILDKHKLSHIQTLLDVSSLIQTILEKDTREKLEKIIKN